MPLPPGIRALETVFVGADVRVVRAFDENAGRTVVLKTLALPFPSAADRALFRSEYDILASLDIDGVPGVYAYHDDPATPHMVMQDVRGTTLAAAFSATPAPLAAFFAIARQAAAVIGAVHERSVLHKDINPSNIIWNPDGPRLTLLDFGIATELVRDHGATTADGHLEGTLAYMAPEQTGRIGRPVDARSDLYGLGATLYFVLTGAPPFSAVDPAALVHAHIALPAPSPLLVRPEVPQSVGAIVLKLLEKEPAQRYRSTFGLLCDLEQSEQLWRDGADDSTFVAGSRDRVATLAIPDRLYGREAETAVLRGAFERTCDGEARSVCVRGFAGIGKSALVAELLSTLVGRHARFCRGKFDQFKRNVPFAALAQMIDELVTELAHDHRKSDDQGPSDSDALSGMADKWRQACGANLVLVTQLAPSLARYFADLSNVPPLSPTEARNRLLLHA